MVFKIPGLRYDPDDLDLLLCRAWSVSLQGYLHSQIGTLHRRIGERIAGRKLKRHEFVDHVNGDKLDNRRANLRIVSCAVNQQNRQGPQRNGTSGYRGVTWDEAKQSWYASAFISRRRIARRFSNKDEAGRFVARIWEIRWSFGHHDLSDDEFAEIRRRIFAEFPDRRKQRASDK